MGLFAVDQWRCHSQLYFLTHMHADHTNGLSSSWCRGPIYCSAVTAALLLSKFQGLGDTLVHTLEVGTTALITVPQERAESKLLEVTPILANHCPGGVMYLFRGEFGCILHTGDFRWEHADEGSINGKQQLLAALKGGSVDRLYLDNTFCHPRFKFPPRHVALQQILQIIAEHPLHDIIVGVDSLGKEELLLKIAQAFNTKIWVWPERLQTMRLLGLPDIFTTDSTATRIRAVPRYSMSERNLQILNSIFRPTIGILPTGCLCPCKPACWNSSNVSAQHISHVQSCNVPNAAPQQAPDAGLFPKPVQGDHSKPNARISKQCACSVSAGGVVGGIHVVNYSLHCSFLELESFIRTLKPRMVIGTVPRPGSLETDPSRHFGSLLKQARAECVQSPDVTEMSFSGRMRATTSTWKCAKNQTIPRVRRQSLSLVKLQQGVCSRLNTFCRPRRKRVGTQLFASLEGDTVKECAQSFLTGSIDALVLDVEERKGSAQLALLSKKM